MPSEQHKRSVTFADVSDIFNQHCTTCHSGDDPPLGLRRDSYEHVMAGSEERPVVVPGKPRESDLVMRIKVEVEPAMPFGNLSSRTRRSKLL